MNSIGSSSTVEIDAPIEVVWRLLADIEGWSRWAPKVEVLRSTTVEPDASFDWKLNGIAISAAFAVVDPPHELSWRGRLLFFRALDRNILAAIDGNRTRVTFEESLAGPLVRVLYRSSQLKANHERWLQALKATAEGTHEPKPEYA